MKTLKFTILILFLIINNKSYSQKNLSEFKDVTGVFITSYWGDVKLTGTKGANQFSMEAVYTDTSKKPILLKNLTNYVTLEVKNKKLFIQVRKPKGFESIDLRLNIPAHLFIEIKLLKGGNIYAKNFKNGIEVNSLNGSVKLERINKYALVNAANGEVNVSFNKIDAKTPISLVTLNGGVTAFLPENAQRDIRLISRKNGYVETDFNIVSDKNIINLNIKKYAKQSIINSARINGGGALLFLSTENGPITIKKLKS